MSPPSLLQDPGGRSRRGEGGREREREKEREEAARQSREERVGRKKRPEGFATNNFFTKV